MKWIAALLIILVAAGCETISPSRLNVNPRYSAFQVHRVAIMPFEGVPVQKEVEEFNGWWRFNYVNSGEVISDIFTNEMLSLPLFDYIERSQIRKVIEEQNLSMTDWVRSKTAAEMGKLLGVDAVIVGQVHKLYRSRSFLNTQDSYVSFSVRMVDTATGTVLWSATVEHEISDMNVLQVARQECAAIVKELGEKLAPTGAK